MLPSSHYTAAQKFPCKQPMKICQSVSQTIVDIKQLNGNHTEWVCSIENNIAGYVFDESVFL